MNTFLTVLLIAISLSMDAFSLACVYGTYGMSKKNQILLSVIVGCFHFFMPLIGLFVGSIILKYFLFNLELVVGIIFIIIGIEMIMSFREERNVNFLVSFWGFLLFGLSVSIDSFTTGIGLSIISHNYIGVAFLFMVVSGAFTYIGLGLGNRISSKFGVYSTVLGGVLMCLLGLLEIF